MKTRWVILTALLTTTLLALLFAPTAMAAMAATITVDRTADTLVAGDGECTLREAIHNANSNSDTTGGDCEAGSGADLIELTAGSYALGLAGADEDNNETGDLDILDDVTIQGAGAATSIVDGSGLDRVFDLHAPHALTLDQLTVRGGYVTGSAGGGIRNEGGTLALTGSTVRDNEVVNGHGGGIFTRASGTDATTTVDNSQVISNTAGVSGGGLMIIGDSNVTATLTVNQSEVRFNHADDTAGGIRSTRVGGASNHDVQVNVLASDVSYNTTSNSAGVVGGGGLVINYAEFLMADSVVSYNVAETGAAHGGGLVSAFSEVTILRSLFHDNQVIATASMVPPGGGALFNCDGQMTIANSTISNNQATGDASGGALLALDCFGSAPSIVNLINTTVSGNSADGAAGTVATYQGTQPVTVNVVNTIVSHNLASNSANCVAAPGTTIASLGHNLEDQNTCNFNQPRDLTNTDPMLGPLQDNGGPTMTHALLDGSPAIGAADDTVCAGVPVAGVDQRGVARPQGTHCDIGAYEATDEPSALRLSTLSSDSAVGRLPVLGGLALLLATVSGLALRRRRRG